MWKIFLKKWLQLTDVLTADYARFVPILYQEFLKMLTALAPYTGDIKGKRILDLGCGRFAPFTLLLHTQNIVTGIDIVHVGFNEKPLRRYWSILKEDGVQRFVTRFLSSILLKDRAYYKTLETLCSFSLTKSRPDIRKMNAEDMDFLNETFDIAVSFAVFEHVSNVPRVVSELSRVMKTGGIAYIAINLYASLDGGHHPNWSNFDKVPPWDHLREQKLPLTCPLNKTRKDDFIKYFREKLEVQDLELDMNKERVKALLTPEIRIQLLEYSEEELVNQGIIIIARKESENQNSIVDFRKDRTKIRERK